MSSPEAAQRLCMKLLDWLREQRADIDDVIPALLVVTAKLAASDHDLEGLLTLLRTVFDEERKKQLQTEQPKH